MSTTTNDRARIRATLDRLGSDPDALAIVLNAAVIVLGDMDDDTAAMLDTDRESVEGAYRAAYDAERLLIGDDEPSRPEQGEREAYDALYDALADETFGKASLPPLAVAATAEATERARVLADSDLTLRGLLDDLYDIAADTAAALRRTTERPTPEYVPGGYTDEDGATDAHLVCAACAGTSFYEVDRAERWTDVEGDTDGLTVSYDGHGDYESDHLRCQSCGTVHDYPSNWNEIHEIAF